MNRARQYLDSRLPSLSIHSVEEYFTVLLGRALQAKSVGNYGIAAALVLECDGMEIVSFGSSSLYSEGDPLGHAEINAIRGAQALALTGDSRDLNVSVWRGTRAVAESNGQVFVRRRKSIAGRFSTLYTTLEPCPMCTVAILNARINRVVVALADETGGSLAPERLTNLPKIWGEVADQQGLEVQFLDQTVGDGPKVPRELLSTLKELFLEGRERLDSKIMRDGVLRSGEACSVGQDFWRQQRNSRDDQREP